MKVYLSRSNAADPAVFSIVKKVIEDLGHDVVTFNGGEYSKEPLLSCQAIVVVPGAEMLPSLGRYEDDGVTKLIDDCPDVGKGQYEQCMDFAKTHAESFDKMGTTDEIDDILMHPDKLMLVVQEVDNSEAEYPTVYVHNITAVRTQDLKDWKSKYGFLTTDESYNNIGMMLGREMQTKLPTCPTELLYPVSNSPMLGAARLIGVL